MKRILLLLTVFLFLFGCSKADGPVVVALLDTGISSAAIDSPNLLPGHNYLTGTDETQDAANHGTAVAGVLLGSTGAEITGLAPDCQVVPLVIADSAESVSPEVLAQAIRDAVDQYNADIINLSLGIRSNVEALEQAVAYAEKRGVLVVCAVGNGGDETLYYPAAYETPIAVGSHDRSGQVSDFSQRNGTADLLAPGEDIWLASANGSTYSAKGTSYATAYVTAAAANLLAQNRDLSPAQLRQRLYEAAQDLQTPGFDFTTGWGRLVTGEE